MPIPFVNEPSKTRLYQHIPPIFPFRLRLLRFADFSAPVKKLTEIGCLFPQPSFHLSFPSKRPPGGANNGARETASRFDPTFAFAPRREILSGNRPRSPSKLRRAETTWPRVSNFVGRPEPRIPASALYEKGIQESD